jgi:hypothetical protein
MSHVDTPRNEKMFGSLVVVYPTPHEGGSLVFRHHDENWTFDSSAALSSALPNSISYAAFFSDVDHEILPVKSGHRVSLTYNLCFDDDERPSAKPLVSEHPPAPMEENERKFRSEFEVLLNSPEFLPNGGLLGFKMRHLYQINDKLEHVYGLLKASDAIVYQNLRALGFEPVLYLHYQDTFSREDGRLVNYVPDFENMCGDGGVASLLWGTGWGDNCLSSEEVTWVTPKTTFNTLTTAYPHYGNEATVQYAYAQLCLIVRIGSLGARLAHPLRRPGSSSDTS